MVLAHFLFYTKEGKSIMAEFTYNPIQLITAGAPAIFNNTISCPKGYVIHRPESGICILRGIVNNRCAKFARYQVVFNGNIALPEGATVGPISVAIAIDGEPIFTSNAIVTPAAVDQYFNVTSTAIVDVPRGCCFNLAVENTSVGETTNPSINMQNANLVITRIA